MNTKWVSICCLVTLAALSSGQLRLKGSYEILTIPIGHDKAVGQDPRTTPKGQLRRLYVEGNKCVMMDARTQFTGFWRQGKSEVVLTWTHGPKGKLKKPTSMHLRASADKRTYTMIGGREIRRIVFHWVPEAVPVKFP